VWLNELYDDRHPRNGQDDRGRDEAQGADEQTGNRARNSKRVLEDEGAGSLILHFNFAKF